MVFIHFCSTSVPFGNQAKTYVVPDEHIVKEIKLALQQALRDISGRIARKQKKEKQEKKFEEKLNIAVLLASKVYEILEVDELPPYESIAKICGAELVSDEENNTDKIVVSKKRIDELFAKAR